MREGAGLKMTHMFFDAEQRLRYAADPEGFAKSLTGPMFVGQGLSKRVGSDCYGYFITAEKKVGKKTIWGLTSADDEFVTSWTEGTMKCKWPGFGKADMWIAPYGKDKRTGRTKWWECDENGRRFKGRHARFDWTGSYSYRDPSF